jgi:murein DD-endopeptidase MepM/ murein hydrolase activator NlpD
MLKKEKTIFFLLLIILLVSLTSSIAQAQNNIFGIYVNPEDQTFLELSKDNTFTAGFLGKWFLEVRKTRDLYPDGSYSWSPFYGLRILGGPLKLKEFKEDEESAFPGVFVRNIIPQALQEELQKLGIRPQKELVNITPQKELVDPFVCYRLSATEVKGDTLINAGGDIIAIKDKGAFRIKSSENILWSKYKVWCERACIGILEFDESGLTKLASLPQKLKIKYNKDNIIVEFYPENGTTFLGEIKEDTLIITSDTNEKKVFIKHKISLEPEPKKIELIEKEETRPEFAGYIGKVRDPLYFLDSMITAVLECPKEKSCNDYEEEAAKVLISHLLTKKYEKKFFKYVAKEITIEQFKEMLSEIIAQSYPLYAEEIKMAFKLIDTVIEKEMESIGPKKGKVEDIDLEWKDIHVLLAYFPYKDRDRNLIGEALVIFYSPHSVSIKEIKKEVTSGGRIRSVVGPNLIPLEEKLKQFPDEGIVKPFKLIIRGKVYERYEVVKKEVLGGTIKGPLIIFFGDKESVSSPEIVVNIVGKWVPEIQNKVEGKDISTLEFKEDGTVIDTMIYSGKWKIKGDKEIEFLIDPQFFPGAPHEIIYQIKGDTISDIYGNVFTKEKDAKIIKLTAKEKIWNKYKFNNEDWGQKLELRENGTFISTIISYGKYKIDGNVIKIYSFEGEEEPWIYELKGEKIEVKPNYANDIWKIWKDKISPNCNFVPFVKASTEKVVDKVAKKDIREKVEIQEQIKEEIYPKEVKMDIDLKKELNTFFSDIYPLGSFIRDKIDNKELICFAIWRNVDNNRFECGKWGVKVRLFKPNREVEADCRVKAKYVEETIEKYFGIKLQKHESVPECAKYKNGYYYFPGAEGEAAFISQVVKLFQIGPDLFKAYVNNYVASNVWEGDPNASPAEWRKFLSEEIIDMSKFVIDIPTLESQTVAIIKKVRSGSKERFILIENLEGVSYRGLDYSKLKISQGFGAYLGSYKGKIYNGYHGGEDIQAEIGTPVYAIMDGTVAKISNLGELGYLIAIKHDYWGHIPARAETVHGKHYKYPAYRGPFYSVYMHVTPVTNLREGSLVIGGDRIATVAKTTLPPHLHFEIRLPNARHSKDWSLVGEKENWSFFPDTGKYNGYYKDPQKMVDAGLRCPSDLFKETGLHTPIPLIILSDFPSDLLK